MTQDEIIRMTMDSDGHMNDHARGIDLTWDTLVKVVQTAIAHEREVCAAICDRFAERDMHPAECAAAIRERGEK